MRSHLSSKHKSLSLDGPPKAYPRQTTLSGFASMSPRVKLPSGRQEQITRKLALMCALDLKPISLCEGVGFRTFCSELNPQYQVPTRKTVTKYLNKIYDEEKEKLQQKLTGQSVGMTSDLWTSNAVQGYITVTAHHITPEWELKCNVLGTRCMEERHTGINIGLEIDSMRREFNILNSPGLTTDNASNMTIAAQQMAVPHVNCFSHTIQLAVQDGLKIPQISKTLGAARKLVSHFNYSVVSTNALLAKQKTSPDSKPLKLIQDVATRWNSSFYMINRLLKLRVPVYAAIFDDTVTKPGDRVKLDIKDCHWKNMEDIAPILEPMEQITEILGKEDAPTGSGVFVLIHSLFSSVLCQVDGESGVVRELKVKIREGLKKRFNVNEQGVPSLDCVKKNPLLLATLLDPRYKSLIGRILDAEHLQTLKELLLGLMESSQLPDHVETVIKEEPNDPISPKRPKFLDILNLVYLFSFQLS